MKTNKKIFKLKNSFTNKLEWRLWVILLIEFIGTFLMTLEIILPSSMGFGTNPNLNEEFNNIWQQVFGSFLMKAIWVTGFIFILIYTFRKISVNLNPIVSISEAIAGLHKWPKAFLMVATQFLGGFLAAGMGLILSHISGAWSHTQTLDGLEPKLLFNGFHNSLEGKFIKLITGEYKNINVINLPINGDAPGIKIIYSIISYIIEAIFSFILISTVIYFPKVKGIKSNQRPFLIIVPLTIIVALGIHTNNIALNPARLIAPSVVASSAGGAQTMQYIWVFLLGELTAVGFVAFIEYCKQNNKKIPSIFGTKSENNSIEKLA